MIKTYIQGHEPAADRELFGLVGQWITSRNVHKTLGMAVTTDPGDVWLVTVGDGGAPEGFCVMHLLRSYAGAHLRYLFAPDELSRVRRPLLHAALDLAAERQLSTIYTLDRETEKIWVAHGFTSHKHRRGVFCRWDKTLKEPKK